LLAGLVPDARELGEPLSALGLVLLGSGQPIVLVSVDWCEIRNEAHDRWRKALAEAAGTTPERVMVSAVHQHDAPLADLAAQRILEERKLPVRICDRAFHEKALEGVARALRESLGSATSITHIGIGQAKVAEVASNRRYIGPDGKLAFNRTSATLDPAIRAQPEGTIDPWLKTISFWHGDHAVLALSAYATHPMSYYRTGRISCDFPGLARRRRQLDDATTMQIYVSGASGNVTAGKYNDGSPLNRPILADRLYHAMVSAWKATRRHPLEQVEFRAAPLRLAPRSDGGYTAKDLQKQLVPNALPREQIHAALGMSWLKRTQRGALVDVPVVDFGIAQLMLLPAESYVEYQLLAQKLRPDSFVVVAGYGECGPGYIPTEQAWKERDGNLQRGDWCWTAPGAEQAMRTAIAEALRAQPESRSAHIRP